MDNPTLVVGGKYENREGFYEVHSIEGDRLVIVYDIAKQLTTSTEMQTRILDNLAWDRLEGMKQ